ncbi:hypothetical protein AB32_4264 [Escherichia coli 2-316-03_S1_C2]|nr:hypothetical protein AC12_4376 [Escherichia coli 2-005-03_S3_C2]KEJ23339.1 hypothetical protein AB32_4264 [Escherichia coli 2-316-03_S1_C2]KEJ31666.1 hypothetical protein AB03_0891 [Escherichia coli 2-316-03_S1_C1]UFD96215.1 hypothetical protein [Escherichia coli]
MLCLQEVALCGGERKIRNCRKPDLRREKEELLQDKHKKWWFVEIW